MRPDRDGAVTEPGTGACNVSNVLNVCITSSIYDHSIYRFSRYGVWPRKHGDLNND
jgi:hypothetical protein